jgi:3-methylcrotonyl-CoA carboxylase alpha subunit
VSDARDDRSVSVVALGNGRFQIDDGPTRRTAFAVVAGDTWVFLDGRVFVLAESGPVARRSGPDDATALMAPMPATVVNIHAAVGQEVGRDALLISLEAMKMELPIKAPRAGRVTAIRCRVGELVQPGVPLLEIEHGP